MLYNIDWFLVRKFDGLLLTTYDLHEWHYYLPLYPIYIYVLRRLKCHACRSIHPFADSAKSHVALVSLLIHGIVWQKEETNMLR